MEIGKKHLIYQRHFD